MKAFLAGLGIGAAAAVLFAPLKGEEARDILEKRVSRIKENLKAKRDVMGASPKPNLHNGVESLKAPGKTAAAKLGSESKAVAEVLNSADRHELMSVNGIGKTTATRIMKHRPYSSAEEVLEEGVLPEETLEHVKDELLHKKRDIA